MSRAVADVVAGVVAAAAGLKRLLQRMSYAAAVDAAAAVAGHERHVRLRLGSACRQFS